MWEALLVLSKYVIYGLVDPKNNEIRYIGKSSKGLLRPKQHSKRDVLARDTNLQKKAWIEQLLAENTLYTIKILEQLTKSEDLNRAEQNWIMRGRANKWPLFNQTDGGEGGAIGVWTAERRAKSRASHIGRPKHTPESRARLSMLAKARAQTPEGQEKLRRITDLARQKNIGHSRGTGRKASAETRAKMSKARLGRKRPDIVAWWKTPEGAAHQQHMIEAARQASRRKPR